MLCERGVNTLLLFGVPESVAGWKGRYEAVQPLWPWQTLSVGGDGGRTMRGICLLTGSCWMSLRCGIIR